ncbi:MAG: M23 family metallopeptidase [Sporichthyaceae bacterium]
MDTVASDYAAGTSGTFAGTPTAAGAVSPGTGVSMAVGEDRAQALRASRNQTRAKHARPYAVETEHAAERVGRSKARALSASAARATTEAAAKAKAKAEATTAAKAKARTAAKRAGVAAPRAVASGVPLAGGYRISSTFAAHAGRMKGGVGGGIDYAVPIGTRVYATHAGTVRAAGSSGGGYGIWVVVDYGRGYRAVFAHLSRTNVKRGDAVPAGALLGWSGSTGRSTGPHLHYELRRNGVSVDPRTVDLRR